MAQCRRIHGEGGCCAWGRSVPSREAQRWRLTPPAAQRFLEKMRKRGRIKHHRAAQARREVEPHAAGRSAGTAVRQG